MSAVSKARARREEGNIKRPAGKLDKIIRPGHFTVPGRICHLENNVVKSGR